MKVKVENHESHFGYYIYSAVAIIGFLALFGFISYLIYDLFIKLATQDITNATLIQSIVTLVITIFIGGFYSKHLELKNSKKLEYLKVQKEIALNIINLVSKLSKGENIEETLNLLYFESDKAELFFNDDVAEAIRKVYTEVNNENYNMLLKSMKQIIKA